MYCKPPLVFLLFSFFLILFRPPFLTFVSFALNMLIFFLSNFRLIPPPPNIFLILFLLIFLTFLFFLRSSSPCCFLFISRRRDWYAGQNFGKDMKYLLGWAVLCYVPYSFTTSKWKQLYLWAFDLVTRPLHVSVFVHTLFTTLQNIVICPQEKYLWHVTHYQCKRSYHIQCPVHGIF